MFIFGFLVFILAVVAVGLLYEYHSQAEDWLERLVSEMTHYVSSGPLNTTNSLHAVNIATGHSYLSYGQWHIFGSINTYIHRLVHVHQVRLL